ncbi:DUF1302 family protein [Thermodesulforhabdus norvegica]|uniref:Phosphate-selective porin O and P n=1 Tax=Thermodesulforhabdus norvegica TaxID=39841 RepID=A0A1I4SP65_9BACT|nr:DUF1302 family protein [Thermodesulforhabdus norvegica]SFM66171.1 hypothetical protein SAMN05660836_01080 [Thermodesulforhabdus norvegica]
MKRRVKLLVLLVFVALPGIGRCADSAGASIGECLENVIRYVKGFMEVSGASRVAGEDAAETRWLLGEVRLQLDYTRDLSDFTLSIRPEFVVDGVDREVHLDLREAYVLLPFPSLDLKLGRQIITWGTGDFVFLNDVFPKDWQSFFIGRDDEYLKKPANAVRWTFYFDLVSLDVAWIPFFTGDTFVSGERLSYYDFMKGEISGPENPEIDPDYPARCPTSGEIAGRIFKTFGSWETSLYGYRGRWGQPLGYDPGDDENVFPRLEVWGGSFRGPAFGGIINGEFAWYRSLDDLDGDNPYMPNSEIRWLIGYSKDVAPDQTLGVQAYVEHLLNFGEYEESGGKRDRERLWLTLRYTGLFMRQNLTVSFFGFFSPLEEDMYLRPKLSYKYSDAVTLVLGANIFYGNDDDTFFGQFEGNTNVYARIRYYF